MLYLIRSITFFHLSCSCAMRCTSAGWLSMIGVKPATSMRLRDIRIGQHRVDLAVEPLDDRLRHAGRAVDVVDRGAVEARQRVGDRRQVGQRRIALDRRDPERAQAAGLDVRQQHRDGVDRHLHVAGEQVLQRRAGAAIGDMHDVDPGHHLEQLARQMRARADAGAGEIELAGIGLGVGDQLGDGLDRQARRHRPAR